MGSVLTKNFCAEQRSAAVSLAKSWLGVSAAAVTAIYAGLFPDDETSMHRLNILLFQAAIAGLGTLLLASFVRVIPNDDRSEQALAVSPRQLVRWCYAITAVLIAMALLSSFCSSVPMAVSVVAVCLSPTLLLLRRPSSTRGACPSKVVHKEIDEQKPTAQMECGPAGMLRHVEFYLLWLCALVIQAGGIFITTNSASMVQSRSGLVVASATVVTVFSSFNALARLCAGLVSDFFVSMGAPRAVCFPILALTMGTAHAFLSCHGAAALIVGSALAGAAYGFAFPLLVIVVAEVFGESRVASNYMVFDGSPQAIGSVLIAQCLATAVYSSHEVCDDAGTCECSGDECFRLAHLVIAALNAAGCCVGTLLTLRMRANSQAVATEVKLDFCEPIGGPGERRELELRKT